MASSWGDSWGSSWASSWGSISPAPATTADTHDPGYHKEAYDRLKKHANISPFDAPKKKKKRKILSLPPRTDEPAPIVDKSLTPEEIESLRLAAIELEIKEDDEEALWLFH